MAYYTAYIVLVAERRKRKLIYTEPMWCELCNILYYRAFGNVQSNMEGKQEMVMAQ